VGYGADPSHCLRTAIGQAERCIGGNHDLGADGRVPLGMFAPWARAALAWTRAVIGPVGRANLERLQPQDLGAPVPIYHASPRDPVWEYVTEDLQAQAALADSPAPLTLIGHTHVPFAWRLTTDGTLERVGVPADGRLALAAGRWLVNPGSVGQPRDDDARAAWALYDPDAGVLEFRRTPYDVAAAQNAILEAGLPSLLAHRLAEGR
jgi:diadenosine tetraphosphatase ApaH/serine/threonine PP2A family protein phosphatase